MIVSGRVGIHASTVFPSRAEGHEDGKRSGERPRIPVQRIISAIIRLRMLKNAASALYLSGYDGLLLWLGVGWPVTGARPYRTGAIGPSPRKSLF
jgi:hypothetical protein